MQFFISYRFTGENTEKLKTLLESIQKTIESSGHTNFCSFTWQSHFDKNKFSNKEILDHCLNELEQSEALIVFINSAEKSEEILLEVGYAYAKKKKIYLLIREHVTTTFIEAIADKRVVFQNTEEIPKCIQQFL